MVLVLKVSSRAFVVRLKERLPRRKPDNLETLTSMCEISRILCLFSFTPVLRTRQNHVCAFLGALLRINWSWRIEHPLLMFLGIVCIVRRRRLLKSFEVPSFKNIVKKTFPAVITYRCPTNTFTPQITFWSTASFEQSPFCRQNKFHCPRNSIQCALQKCGRRKCVKIPANHFTIREPQQKRYFNAGCPQCRVFLCLMMNC